MTTPTLTIEQAIAVGDVMTPYQTLLAAAIAYRRNPFDYEAREALSIAIKASEMDIAEQANEAARAADDQGAGITRLTNRDIEWSR